MILPSIKLNTPLSDLKIGEPYEVDDKSGAEEGVGVWRRTETRKLITISNNPKNKDLVTISLFPAQKQFCLPKKLIKFMNFSDFKKLGEKTESNVLLESCVEKTSREMVRIYKRATDSNWEKYGKNLFNEVLKETTAILFGFKTGIYPCNDLNLLNARHSMKEQLEFKKKHGRFGYTDETLDKIKTVTLFAEKIEMTVGVPYKAKVSLNEIDFSGTSLYDNQPEITLNVFIHEDLATLTIKEGDLLDKDSSCPGFLLKETFLDKLGIKDCLKLLLLNETPMRTIQHFYDLEGEGIKKKELDIFHEFCKKNRINESKIKNIELKSLKNIPVLLLKNRKQDTFFYSKGDVNHILATGSLPQSYQKTRSLLEKKLSKETLGKSHGNNLHLDR